ncbi:MAG TPA: phenylalanine--tRNA ligase subunit beta [Alphaproteobacteria bacterium]|nr:phenylalanine--tRNA ligase subunit beta [Alphaproteobacteria bacterium]
MKLTLSWLKEHLDTTADLNTIVETLTRIGLEVEEVYNPLDNLKGFITARAENVTMHPDSDHLHVLTVNTGTEKLQVVCGAPNVKEGLIGIFAPVGTNIPCYNEVLKVGKIRGVESFGMMCSEKELCVGEDHTGIIELPQNTKIGVPAAEVLNIDPVIEIAITPNRAECLGVRGVARDLAAAGLGTLKPLEIKKIKGTFESPIKVKVLCQDECPTYVGRYIKNVDNTRQTPKWMKDRLTAIGLRSISPLVDVTNYINYDLARPLHVFDADKIKGDITVRMCHENEHFVALDEKEYDLDTLSLGICDDEGIECLGGIMGGLEKGCSENTKNVFLECALFKPACIARTGRKFAIESDSRYRYERWVDPKSNVLGSDYATQLITEICGGEVSEVMIEGDENAVPQVAYIRPSRMKTFVGMDVSERKIIEILSRLGFETSVEGDKIKAVSPSWRGDIECEQDLIEEVVRMIGLDEIEPQSMPHDQFPKQALTPAQARTVTVKHELALRGMYETVTWSFTSSKLADIFHKSNQTDIVLLANPISADLDEMRPSLLPNLLIGAKNNIARGYANMSIFEVGPEFYGRHPKEETNVAAGIRVGLTADKDWGKTSRPFDLFDAKADALAAIAAAKGPIDNPQITTDAPAYYHPGRSGAIRLGKNVLAYFGELHPSVMKKFGLKTRVVAFEVYLDNIPLPRATHDKARKKLELSAFQPVVKDLAFVVDENVSAAAVLAAAKNADRNLITEVRLFDLYEGENLPQGKKSLAISVVFQPNEQTFTDKDIENLMNKVIVSVNKNTGGELRA